MDVTQADSHFTGSIPQFYERYLVPLIFEPYAVDLATRVASRKPRRVLEIAAGTGVVTRQLAKLLPRDTEIIASDLNRPMLDHAASLGIARPVEWREANAMSLPFGDESFDAVVCQFAVMFFAEKVKAFSEARRVLRPGGTFFFSVWDRIEDNDFAHAITNELSHVFPDDPPRFLARTPHGYHDPSNITNDLQAAGFDKPVQWTVVEERSRAESPRDPVVAYCEGTPLRNEIEARGEPGLAAAMDAATAGIAREFGGGAIDGKIQALVIEAER